MKIIYKGVDIYPEISVNQCYHDMYAEGHSDEILLRLNDTQGRWDDWNPQKGDDITITTGNATTGKMFITNITPENGTIALRALSTPLTALDPNSKSWEEVRLCQICEEIASRHGLTFIAHGITDRNYKFVSQVNEPDFVFLHRRCQLEGAAFLVFDGKLIVYDEQTFEGQPPTKTVRITTDTEYELNNNSDRSFGKAAVTNGSKKGVFTMGNGQRVLKKPLPIYMQDDVEACRYAAGLLRNANKIAISGIVWSKSLMDDIAAASMVMLASDPTPSWDGPMFVHRIRHEYEACQTKIFMRRPLEGY